MDVLGIVVGGALLVMILAVLAGRRETNRFTRCERTSGPAGSEVAWFADGSGGDCDAGAGGCDGGGGGGD